MKINVTTVLKELDGTPLFKISPTADFDEDGNPKPKHEKMTVKTALVDALQA
ncbi:MAG: hypothetical protein GTN68_02130, partial [Candidatus Aminicenantes bacterium]|nr:hypothetical protein [Candidatus Aminicenantes bacterium]NIO79338.1 hypothetical protein [Candidatus Aminicenantes bacterium]NIQ65305.1 hypothetical protein [Candidatus Aminicenantes bacterium]